MQKLTFVGKVSKGTRFNQVYIPKRLEQRLEPGDEVEVKLVRKKQEIYYSAKKELPEFKLYIIRKIFSAVESFTEIKQCLIVGSFLSKKSDYKDIDIVIVMENQDPKLHQKVVDKLTEKVPMALHVISIREKDLGYLLESCPVTRLMFSDHACNKELKIVRKKRIDKNHISFLMMLPEDLLEINASGKVFLDAIRRLIAIERFLKNNKESTEEVDKEITLLIDARLIRMMKDDEKLEKTSIKQLRTIISRKIDEIRRWQKRQTSKS